MKDESKMSKADIRDSLMEMAFIICMVILMICID